MQSTWRLILTEGEIQQAVQNCADHINQNFQNQEVVVACILKGAVYFFVDLTRKLTIPHSCYFIEASSYHGSQQAQELEILSVIQPEKFQGKKVILIDELFDNGETLHRVKVAISEKAQVSLEDIFTCTVFRKDKDTKLEPPDLCGITTPDVWLVGYGLDDRQHKRNLTDLYGCPKVEGIAKSDDDVIFDDPLIHEQWRKKARQICK